jgi:hypothetical protein
MKKYFKKYWWILLIIVSVVVQEGRIHSLKKSRDIGTSYMYGWYKGATRGMEMVKYQITNPNMIMNRAKMDSAIYVSTINK